MCAAVISSAVRLRLSAAYPEPLTDAKKKFVDISMRQYLIQCESISVATSCNI